MQFSPFDIQCKKLNPLGNNTTEWTNTLKQFAGNSPQIVFD